MFFIGPMLHHPPQSPACVGNKPRGKPICPGWDGDTLPVYSYQERNSEYLLISGFSTWNFNRGQNSTLNAIDPQPPPSSTYKKGLGIVPQMQIDLYIREKNMQMLVHDKTSRLIGSGPIRPTVRPSKGQSSVLQAIDHSVVGSMTAQPPGSRPSALRVAAHGQQAAPLVGGGSYTSAEVQSAYSTAPADRATERKN